jgi:micrococcal nuclease
MKRLGWILGAVLTLTLVLTSINPGAASRFLEGRVVKVVDGDTIIVSFGPGTRFERVRMIGVDAPELGTIAGVQACDYTTRMLQGTRVYLEFDVQMWDHYGRLLAYVWRFYPGGSFESEVRSRMFNARLLLDGYASVLTIPPNVKYSQFFVKFEQEARTKKVGLWNTNPYSGYTPVQNTSSYSCIGDKNTKKFHKSSCPYASMILLKNRVLFKTRLDAINAGYIPCKVCRP